MMPIKSVSDFLLLLLVIVAVIPFIAAVFLFEVWLGIQMVTLLLEGEYIEAFGWSVVFAIVISMLGGIRQALVGR